jgi:integrase
MICRHFSARNDAQNDLWTGIVLGIVLPKPLFLRRPSGLYVRFLVPAHARAVVGSRFIVRSLGPLRGDSARLEAARLGYALAHQFAAIKKHRMEDPAPAPTLAERIAAFVRSHPRAEPALRLFLSVVGDKPMDRLTPADVARFNDAPKDGDASEQLMAFLEWDALTPAPTGRVPVAAVPDVSRYSLDMRADGGFTLSADGPEDHALAMEAVRAMRASPAPAAALSPTHLYAPPVVAAMLGERIELFLTQFRQKKRAESNVADTTFSLRLLLGIVSDKPLASLCAEDMDRFLDAIAHWPANATKKAAYKGLAPAAVVAKAKKLGAPGIAERTQEKHLDRIRVFLNWAVHRRELAHNPATELHVLTREQEETRSRRAFTIEELRAIFDPARRAEHCDTPMRFWAPLLALYTGARAAELATLRTNSVEEINGIWGMSLAAHEYRGKNKNARRFVPVHPALLEAGFLDYRADVLASVGPGPLFPGLGSKPGDNMGDWFNRTYLPKCGVEGGMVFTASGKASPRLPNARA